MGWYWVPTLIVALGVVGVLAVAVVCLSHVRRLQHTVAATQRRTAPALASLQSQLKVVRARR